MDNVKVIGGQMHFTNLTQPEGKQHDMLKARIWVNMINDGMKPTKWLKTGKSGTKVNFDNITSEEERNAALEEYKTFLERMNAEHGTEYKLLMS